MTQAAEPFFDPVTLLVIELTAVAKPRDPTAFVDLLQRFTEAVVREALAHEDEVSTRLGIARQRVNDDSAKACPYCGVEVATMVGHECERMRELGFVHPASQPPAKEDRRASGDGTLFAASDGGRPSLPSSTGAAAVVTAAQPPSTETAARETPAAPSNSVLPAAAGLAASPSQEGVAEATGGADSLAEPAALPLSADAAGAPAASNRRGTVPVLSDEQVRELRAEYDTATRAAGGYRPYGFISKKARELGVGVSTVHRALQIAADQVPPQKKPSVEDLEPTRHRVVTAEPKREPVPDYVAGETALPHTETQACWCRKKQPTREEPWCKLRTLPKPASQHAALKTPEPRVRRIVGTRY